MKNPYETGQQKIIPAVLIYLECKNEILMLHRIVKNNDYHQGKWNGLGGKMEIGETPQEAASRELLEESGILLKDDEFIPLGVLHFPNFKAHKNEDWMVYVFTAKLLTKPFEKKTSIEGNLEWIAKDKLLDLNLWKGDRHFIPLVLAQQPFWGSLFYKDQDLTKAVVTRI